MARVNKVVMGATALLANGGVMAQAGSHAAALAAQRHAGTRVIVDLLVFSFGMYHPHHSASVPFVVLIGLHKLSPLFASDANATLNDLQSPGDIIPYDVVCQHLAAPEEAYGAWVVRAACMGGWRPTSLVQARRLWR